MNSLRQYLASPPSSSPGDYLTPGERVQVELRFACALLTGYRWPTRQECQDAIDSARRLARLLLDGPDAR